MNGLVQQEIPVGEMKPAGITGFPMSATMRHREAAAATDAEKRRFKVDLDILECPIWSEQFSPPVDQVPANRLRIRSTTRHCFYSSIRVLRSFCRYKTFIRIITGCRESLYSRSTLYDMHFAKVYKP